MLRASKRAESARFSSTLTLMTLSRPAWSLASSSRIGLTKRHGPHHGYVPGYGYYVPGFSYTPSCWWQEGYWINQPYVDRYGAVIYVPQRVPGQWPDSPKPTVHDILTGSTADGRVMAGKTCNDWTSEASDQQAQVGHSDGLGPGGDPSGRYAIWNSSHENGSCADTAPRGGAGRIYCFAAK